MSSWTPAGPEVGHVGGVIGRAYSAEVTRSGVVANLELAERSGVWGRRNPQRGPAAEPLVGGQGCEAPLEL